MKARLEHRSHLFEHAMIEVKSNLFGFPYHVCVPRFNKNILNYKIRDSEN